jgi:plasmid stabilization system protein ParE
MKEYTVIWLEPAKENYKDIVRYLKSAIEAEAARKIFTKLVNDINQLGEFPLAKSLVPYEEYREQGVRMLISGSYLCFYIASGTTVEIYHIVHKSRDYCKLFVFHAGGKKA